MIITEKLVELLDRVEKAAHEFNMKTKQTSDAQQMYVKLADELRLSATELWQARHDLEDAVGPIEARHDGH